MLLLWFDTLQTIIQWVAERNGFLKIAKIYLHRRMFINSLEIRMASIKSLCMLYDCQRTLANPRSIKREQRHVITLSILALVAWDLKCRVLNFDRDFHFHARKGKYSWIQHTKAPWHWNAFVVTKPLRGGSQKKWTVIFWYSPRC